jgi:hypothetical protein
MAYRLTQHGRRLEAAACYLEQEPLWLDNAKELLEIVLDWGKLAEAVLLNSKEPCLGNLVEFELYLSQRDRLAAKMLSLSGLRTKPE